MSQVDIGKTLAPTNSVCAAISAGTPGGAAPACRGTICAPATASDFVKLEMSQSGRTEMVSERMTPGHPAAAALPVDGLAASITSRGDQTYGVPG